jgi:hypothetical protein
VRPLPFLAYERLADTPNVVVDGAAAASTRLTLSHWPGSPTPEEVRADLSAEIALLALDRPEWFTGLGAVTNNHFDQDGLASVYALVDPDAAVARRARVVDVAGAGDFGTFADRDAARIAIAIAAWADPETSPLGRDAFRVSYPEQVAMLYAELLPRLTELLDHPERARALWKEEDEHLAESIDAIRRSLVTVDEQDALDLAVVTVPDAWSERATHRFTQTWTEAVHPMAVNNATSCSRVLLVQGRRYRLELRYEGWVMFVSRPIARRPDLRALARELTASEPGDARWEADPPGALTPQLRIADHAESGLSLHQVRARIEGFLATAPAAWDPFAPRS